MAHRPDRRRPPSAGRDGDGGALAIGDLAASFALTPRTIRYYEDQGLLAPRRYNNRRLYDHRDRARLTLICRGKRLGFSLAEIKDFLDLYDAGDHQLEQMRYLIERGRERIAALEHLRRDVDATLADLDTMVGLAMVHLSRHGRLAP